MSVDQAFEELKKADLASWFSSHGRDLPWRQTRDPWAVLVSEIMLQQTQVPRVIERWLEFCSRYPDPATCAAAPLADIISLWSGMGYNRRAVNLHRTAQTVVAEHAGRIPDSLDELLGLPGIGPYTARAVLAFAFEQPVAVLDTNVGRILARVSGRQLDRREAQSAADVALGENDPWVWNQALLDVGATICRSRSTNCGNCPLSAICQWRLAGNPDQDPATASAAVSVPQSRFEGSDRQGRGRLIDALRRDTIALSEAATVMGWPNDPERVDRVVRGLVADGLIRRDGLLLRLPE